jgi:hypothetical protein
MHVFLSFIFVFINGWSLNTLNHFKSLNLAFDRVEQDISYYNPKRPRINPTFLFKFPIYPGFPNTGLFFLNFFDSLNFTFMTRINRKKMLDLPGVFRYVLSVKNPLFCPRSFLPAIKNVTMTILIKY